MCDTSFGLLEHQVIDMVVEGSVFEGRGQSSQGRRGQLQKYKIETQIWFSPGPNPVWTWTLGSGVGSLNAWTGPEVQVQVQ